MIREQEKKNLNMLVQLHKNQSVVISLKLKHIHDIFKNIFFFFFYSG